MAELKFSVLARDGAARRGRLIFPRGIIETPAFMPVGTYGTVKAMTPEELEGLGAEIILGNTFHLMLRPGPDVLRDHGGLHGFMHWQKPILTDSGGFQVWSLATRNKVSEEGVEFNAPTDGSRVFLSPEVSMDMQNALASDIQMVFDECTAYPATEAQARQSMELSLRWAQRSRDRFDQLDNPDRALFGIVQGGMHTGLRESSLGGLQEIGFEGLALGGLSVGETPEERLAVLDFTLPLMPSGKPRYLMGVGLADRHTRCGAARRRHVRLRDPHPACTQRLPVYRRWYAANPQCPVPQRYGAHPGRLRLLHLPELQPCLPASPRCLRRNSGRAAQYHPQPVFLPRVDAQYPGGDRSGPARGLRQRIPGPTGAKRGNCAIIRRHPGSPADST